MSDLYFLNRSIEDAYYYIPFVYFFRGNLNVTYVEKSWSEFKRIESNIRQELPQKLRKSILYAILVYIKSHDVNDAISFIPMKDDCLEDALFELKVWAQLENVHRKKIDHLTNI